MRAPFLLASVLALASLVATLPASGQGNPFAEKPGANDRNVGMLGVGVEGDGPLTVKTVHKDGPAERAGLAAGDVLEGVDGKAFEKGVDAVLAVVAAIERAEAQKKDGQIALTVRGKPAPVKVTFATLGKHAPSCPRKCEKCKKIVNAGVSFLLQQQQAGLFPTELGGKTGKVVVTSLSGLALLSSGAPVEGPLEQAVAYVLAKCGTEEESPFGKAGGGNWNQTNWELAYGAIFLGEVAKRTKRADVKDKLAQVTATLLKNQEQSGGWAHGPGGPNALGYLELEILSNWSLMGLGSAKKNGVDVDAKAIAKALAWIESTSSGDGGVGYSERQGQKGFGEAGRTSGAIVGYSLLGERRQPFFEKMAGFYRSHLKTLETGHVSPCMHLLTGALASWHLGPRDFDDYIETYRLALMTARKPDGSFAPTPTRETKQLHSNTDFTVGPCWTTATYVLILSLGNEKIPVLLGKGGDAKPEKGKPERTATGTGK